MREHLIIGALGACLLLTSCAAPATSDRPQQPPADAVSAAPAPTASTAPTTATAPTPAVRGSVQNAEAPAQPSAQPFGPGVIDGGGMGDGDANSG